MWLIPLTHIHLSLPDRIHMSLCVIYMSFET